MTNFINMIINVIASILAYTMKSFYYIMNNIKKLKRLRNVNFFSCIYELILHHYAKYNPIKKSYHYLKYAALHHDTKLLKIALRRKEEVLENLDDFLDKVFKSEKNYISIPIKDEMIKGFKLTDHYALLNYNIDFYKEVLKIIPTTSENIVYINMKIIKHFSTIYAYKNKDKYINKNWSSYSQMMNLLKCYNLNWSEKDIFNNFYKISSSFTHFSQWKMLYPYLNNNLLQCRDELNNNFFHYYFSYLYNNGILLQKNNEIENKYTNERFFNIVINPNQNHYVFLSPTRMGKSKYLSQYRNQANIIVENLYEEIDELWEIMTSLPDYAITLKESNIENCRAFDITHNELISYIHKKVLENKLSAKENINYNTNKIRKI